MDKTIKGKGCNSKKNIAITMGDPGGVGPELVISLFSNKVSKENNLILVGIPSIFNQAKKLLNVNKEINVLENLLDFQENCINVIDIKFNKKIEKCKIDKNNGKAAFLSIEKSIDLCKKKEVNSVVTAPISKKSLQLAGYNYPGHTEIFANYTNTKNFRMLFLSKYFNVLLHTIHIPLKEVSKKIFQVSLETTIKLGINFITKNMKKKSPTIYVAGLNPHAGENGNIGREEDELITPCINKFQKNNLNIKGPFPPDTLFFQALQEKPDLIIAMYHDQGLIPVKLTDFYGAVNVTVGLPFIRTSPDHGTAFDIAWQGIANRQSMLNAVKFASLLSSI